MSDNSGPPVSIIVILIGGLFTYPSLIFWVCLSLLSLTLVAFVRYYIKIIVDNKSKKQFKGDYYY